jgi:hypothetical protein
MSTWLASFLHAPGMTLSFSSSWSMTTFCISGGGDTWGCGSNCKRVRFGLLFLGLASEWSRGTGTRWSICQVCSPWWAEPVTVGSWSRCDLRLLDGVSWRISKEINLNTPASSSEGMHDRQWWSIAWTCHLKAEVRQQGRW